MPDYIAIATWSFGEIAVRAAAELLRHGRPALDAAIAGAQAVEDDPTVDSVGYGGLPNAVGTVQLDACVMDGRTLACGAVAGVENIRHPAALARCVMEKTPHVLLVGEGARLFAIQQGFRLDELTTPETLADWVRRRARPGEGAVPPGREREENPFGHDTVTVLTMDREGSLGGACSTSGLPHKLPGRVGDSPIIGAGLYVDNTAGAAGATGVGEEAMRIGASLLVVEAMRAGRTAQEACEGAARRINQVAARRGHRPARVAFIALDRTGMPGAACTVGTDFQYAIARPGGVELVRAPEIGAP